MPVTTRSQTRKPKASRPANNAKVKIKPGKATVKKKRVQKKKGVPNKKHADETFLSHLGESVEKLIIPKGTELYRAQPVLCSTSLDPRYDDETGKYGLYFADGIIIPLGMILEYKRPMYICKFRLQKDQVCHFGKYSFREIEGKRFYKNAHDATHRRFRFGIDPLKSYNHFDNSALPLSDIFDHWAVDEGEIFLNEDSLRDVVRVKSPFTGLVSVEAAHDILRRQRPPSTAV